MAAPVTSPTQPSAAVIVFPGSNGERDLLETFERAGFACRYLPADQSIPSDVDAVGLPGGFSYGDYWRAGVLASQGRAVQQIGDFAEGGGLVIGICNGFQILIEAGFLPGALRYNDPPGFIHDWATVRVGQRVDSPWLHGIEPSTTLRVPIAHGEGNYFHPDGPGAAAAIAPVVYEHNPNGSMAGAAAVLDASGRILGIMPHPERASDADLGSTDGLALFTAARRWLADQEVR